MRTASPSAAAPESPGRAQPGPAGSATGRRNRLEPVPVRSASDSYAEYLAVAGFDLLGFSRQIGRIVEQKFDLRQRRPCRRFCHAGIETTRSILDVHLLAFRRREVMCEKPSGVGP